LSGVEIGLWDALGKEKKLPIHKMLGVTKKMNLKLTLVYLDTLIKKLLKLNVKMH
jgi:L-alanine-DL-glutamate epimerase-like enolase superfamily enzyme